MDSNIVYRMVEVNLGVKENERILIVTDDVPKEHNLSADDVRGIAEIKELGVEMYDILSKKYASRLLTFPATGSHGAEPPNTIAEEMKRYNVDILLTYFSLTHTDAREGATKAGVRIASMPGFTREMFRPGGPMDQDYEKIAELSNSLEKILTNGRTIRVYADNGTELVLDITGRKAIADTGLIGKEVRRYGNLPGGEAFIPPVSANGVYIVNSGWHACLKEDMVFRFVDGYLNELTGGGKVGDRLREWLFARRDRLKIAEFGIGTNPGANNPENLLEAEKILGTVHIAVGDSAHIGGDNRSDTHQDFVLNGATVELDGRLLIKKGKFVF